MRSPLPRLLQPGLDCGGFWHAFVAHKGAAASSLGKGQGSRASW